MSLKAGEQDTLNAIEDALARSDPELSSMLAAFGRLGEGKPLPAREQIQSGWHVGRQLAWPLLWSAIVIALIAIGLVVAQAGGKGTCPGLPSACVKSVIGAGW